MKQLPEVTEQEVRAAILKQVDDTTSYNSMQFSSLEQAIDRLVKNHRSRINDFAVLDQEMIDEQEENYPGSLTGAEVGDLVWGDNEMWVSERVVSGWEHDASQRLSDSHNGIEEIAEWVENSLIEGVLSAYNQSKQK